MGGCRPGSPSLVAGVEAADSWATDAHKWLNVPYDCGLAIVADPEVHGRAMAYTAAYLAGSGRGRPSLGDLVPDSSRRARGFAVWAALRELGRSASPTWSSAAACWPAGWPTGSPPAARPSPTTSCSTRSWSASATTTGRTDEIVAEVQREGTCWLGATTWHDQRLIRISVSNATTTEADIDRSADAILAAADSVGRGGPKARHETR